MSLIIRVWNVTRGLSATFVSYFERRNPEALLEIEKENLRALIGRFNQGLVSHAALSERLITQVSRGEREVGDLTTKTNALFNAGEREAAARYALRLKEVKERLAEDRKQLETAEETYRQLVGTREAAIAEARAKIELVRRQIGDLKVKRALADLEGMASAMIGGLGSAGDSLNRLHEMVEEERERASARVRVATVHVEPAELRAREAEQRALASDALADFLLSQNIDPSPSLRALPDYSPDRRVDAVPATKPNKKMN